jgi:hypothetical protein
MKKIILSLAFTMALFFMVKAQVRSSEFHFGAGIRAGLPIGDLGDGYSFGIGGELQAEFGLSDKLTGIITSGYTGFMGKTTTVLGISVKNDALGYIPILAGVRVYPTENIFAGLQLGYGILTGGGSSDGAFNYQPQVGYHAGNFQVALNYNGLSKSGTSNSHIGLTGIYVFGGKAEKK